MKKIMEREYKFLINSIPKCKDVYLINQVYLSVEKNTDLIKNIFKLNASEIEKINEVRIRQQIHDANTIYYLTAKSKGDFERLEYEKVIDKDLAKHLIETSKIGSVRKNRHIIKIKDFKFEFDEYLGKYEQLKTVEVEVQDKKDYYQIIDILKNYFKITFLDITNDKKYKNFNLMEEKCKT